VAVVKFNLYRELKKAEQGKPTKADVGVLLHMATRRYPKIQARIDKAFGITEVR
jgi:hypothetical protein